MNDAIKMQISAYVDGELPQNEAELLLRRMCQDRELRQQAAEYLGMGRAIRGERVIAGMEKLRERVSAALDDTVLHEELAVADSTVPRFFRPVAGVAIAATVALAALIGLQQLTAVPEEDALIDDAAATATNDGYTVPDQDDDLLRDYYLSHGDTSSYFGANSINARLVNLQLREGVIIQVYEPEITVEEEAEETSDSNETPSAETP